MVINPALLSHCTELQKHTSIISDNQTHLHYHGQALSPDHIPADTYNSRSAGIPNNLITLFPHAVIVIIIIIQTTLLRDLDKFFPARYRRLTRCRQPASQPAAQPTSRAPKEGKGWPTKQATYLMAHTERDPASCIPK